MIIDLEKISCIKNYLVGNGISDYSLQEDLLDHFCCVIEEKMQEGESFDNSFSIAMDRITPDGPGKIQQDLNYFLTLKKNVMIRKLVFIFSFLSVLLFLLAIILRLPQPRIIDINTSQWLVTLSLMVFSISTLPYLFYNWYVWSVRKLKKSLDTQ